MTALRCEWSWMAEALDDGRLQEDARAAFERHAASCAICRCAADEVFLLRRQLSALPQPNISDFEHRRERDRLLGRAGRLRIDHGRRDSSRRLRLVLAAFCVLVVGVAGTRLTMRHFDARERRGEGAGERNAVIAAAPGQPPRYEVTSLARGDWSTEEVGTTARIIFIAGSAAFHVHRLERGQRFLVTLPDGEIEVRGTRFVVDVERGRTRYVVVIEGKVAFRRAGAPEALLIGRQRWDAPGTSDDRAWEATSAEADAAPTAAPPVLEPPARVTGRVHVKAPPSATRAPKTSRRSQAGTGRLRARASLSKDEALPEGSDVGASGRPPILPSSSVPSPSLRGSPEPGAPAALADASALFANAMGVFNDARYDEADALWRDFLAQHADDPRAEDAAFLRIVGRTRSHDATGAAEAARRYLAQFPRGLRRREAELVSRQAHDPKIERNPAR